MPPPLPAAPSHPSPILQAQYHSPSALPMRSRPNTCRTTTSMTCLPAFTASKTKQCLDHSGAEAALSHQTEPLFRQSVQPGRICRSSRSKPAEIVVIARPLLWPVSSRPSLLPAAPPLRPR
eukprot:4052419-Pleurochrysis_carterae.AAC.1